MNPVANEGIVTKLKRKMNKSNEEEVRPLGSIETHLIGMNNAMPICAEACACCWDKTIPDDYAGIAEYVAKRSRIGHTSVIEHSNYVMFMSIDICYTPSLLELLDICNFLNTKIVKSFDSSKWYMIIGGSYRGFCDLYLEAVDLNNPVLKAITGNLYTYANSGAFEDICKYGFMDKSMFMNVEPDENFNILTNTDAFAETDMFKIIGIDSMHKLYNNLYRVCADAAKQLSTFDLIKFTTVSIMFKNMSRTCTHQLVRHRNAITQESQRYVNYSNACFSSPALFKDRYDPDHKYAIRFGPASQVNLTLNEIGEAVCGLYSQLHDPAITGSEYALMQEDARAYLPGNVQCRKIYITFTYKNFIKFLNLREPKAAQAEIRKYALGVGDWFRANTEFTTKELCDNFTQPRLLISEPFNIDIDEGIVEESIEVTEADYIKAAGLDEEE